MGLLTAGKSGTVSLHMCTVCFNMCTTTTHPPCPRRPLPPLARARSSRSRARSLAELETCLRAVRLARSLAELETCSHADAPRSRSARSRSRSESRSGSQSRARARTRAVEQALMARLALAARRRGLRGRRLLSQPAWRSGVVPEQTRRCQPHDIMSTARMRRARTRVRARERARRGSSEQRSGARPPRGACCALDEELVAGHDVEHHAEHEPPRARRARRRDAAAAAVVGRHHRNGSRAAQRATGEHRFHVSTELFMLRVVKLLIC